MIKKILLLTLILFFFQSTGLKANTCDITVNPGQSVQQAINQANSGQTICVKQGTYNEVIRIQTDNITLQSYPGERAIINGDTNNNGEGLFELPNTNLQQISGDSRQTSWDALVEINASNTTVKDIDIINSRGHCMRVLSRGKDTKNNTIDNVLLSVCMKPAIQFFGKYSSQNGGKSSEGTIVKNSIIERGEYEYYFQNGGDWGSLINFNGADGITLDNNVIRYGYADGILLDTNKNRTRGVTLSNNIIHDIKSSYIYIQAASDITAFNNLIFESTEHPIKLTPNGETTRANACIWVQVQEQASYDRSGAYTMENINLYNNVMTGCGSGIKVVGKAPSSIFKNSNIYNNTIGDVSNNAISFNTTDNLQPQNVKVYNNLIASKAKSVSGANQSGISYTNNLDDKDIDIKIYGTNGSGVINQPPKKLHTLQDYQGYKQWFKPNNDSPALDKAIQPHQNFDLFNCQRNNTADIGAIEFNGTNCNQPNPTPTNPTEITPTPTTETTPTPSPTIQFDPKFDLDENGLVNILDIIDLIRYLFQ